VTDAFIVGGLVLGVVLVCIYLVLSVKAAPKADLAEALRLFFGCIGMATGAKVCGLAVGAVSLGAITQNDRVYVFLGGLAAIWVCVQTVVRVFLDRSARIPVPSSPGQSETGPATEAGRHP
jgi:hypothetical protein